MKQKNTFIKLNKNKKSEKEKGTDGGTDKKAGRTDKNDNEASAELLTEEKAETIAQSGTPGRLYTSGILPITIIGEVEGHVSLPAGQKATKYEQIIPLIIEAEENPMVKGVLLILNTMGGDVEAGLAISELVAGMDKPSVSLVLGGSHSIGVPLAVCTDYSFIAPSATMMVHPIRTSGLVLGAQQSFDYLKRMQDRITAFVVNHSRITKKSYDKLMFNPDELANDVGSVLIGQKAVEAGLINQVGSLSDALSKLKSMLASQNPSA